MTPDDRDQLKQELSASGTLFQGLDLTTPYHWEIQGLTDPVVFFQNLHLLMPSNGILYVEGTQMSSETSEFYAMHQSDKTSDVIRDTIFPVPKIYHLSFSIPVSNGLKQLASLHPINKLFDHVKAYHEESLIFTFHDAFTGVLQISDSLPEATIRLFCKSMNASCHRIETIPRNPDQLRNFLNLLANPDQVKFVKESWWERLKRRWL